MRRPPLPRIVPLLAVAAGLGFLVAGAPEGARPGAAAVRGGPPAPRAWRRDCAGKPASRLGALALEVVERPAADTALLRARWELGPEASGGARLSLLLPEAAALLEGSQALDLPPGPSAGSSTFLVRFPPDRTLDAAARLAGAQGDADGGAGPSCEAYARLWEAPDLR